MIIVILGDGITADGMDFMEIITGMDTIIHTGDGTMAGMDITETMGMGTGIIHMHTVIIITHIITIITTAIDVVDITAEQVITTIDITEAEL